MNRYAEMALDHWRRHRPRALAAMADPIASFTHLGEEVETRVGSLRDQILGSMRPAETPESYRHRSYQARRQAEEVSPRREHGLSRQWPCSDEPDGVRHYRTGTTTEVEP